ncbi:MAG: peptide ABC transporter substrate-binding protein [Bdellovibrionales bacterium]
MKITNLYRSLTKISGSLTLTALTFLVALCLASPALHAAKNSTLTLALMGEPPQLDHSRATDVESFFVLGHVLDGLVRYDKAGKIIPAAADKWELNEKGAKFFLKKGLKWSDGSPLTAHDFVFAWRVAVDPKTASEYSGIFYHIKNAEAVNKGSKPVTELGVKAVDDTTLEVVFEKPCGYFVSLTAFATFLPIKESFYNAQKGKYGADADKILYNGPYKITNWVHGASMKMEKNPHYWNAKNIHVDVIDIPYMTPDDGARFNLFKTKKIDVLYRLGKDDVQNAQKEKFKLQKFSDGTLFYMLFNFREGRVTANKNLRKAIAAVLNPREYVSKVVTIPGTLPGTGLVPTYMMGVSQSFRKEFPVPLRKQNIAEAKKYLELAKQELKMKTLPTISWTTSDTPVAVREAEYFQNLLKSTLGIDLKIDKQIFKQRLAKQQSGDFDIVSAGWGPDYADPMTFIDLFASWNNNNNGRWVNKEYDALVEKATMNSNQKQRMADMAKAEKIMLDDLAILPLYERTVMYTADAKVQGIVRRAVGYDPDYINVKIKQ